MLHNTKTSAFILGLFLFLGLSSLGYLLGSSAIKVKEYERTVTVKGLSEQEFKADIVIWPIQFTQANNSLTALYDAIEINTQKIQRFLKEKGITEDEITLSSPSITDLSAQHTAPLNGLSFDTPPFKPSPFIPKTLIPFAKS